MIGFSITSMLPFMQLIGGINFIPNFVSSIIGRYIKYIVVIFKDHSESIKRKINNKLEKEKDKKIKFNLDEEELINEDDEEKIKQIIQKKINEAKALKEQYNFFKEITSSEIKITSENRLNSLLELIERESKNIIPHSFVLSGIYSINFLIFVPIAQVFSISDNVLSIKMFLFLSIILHIFFQLMLQKKGCKHSKIALLYVLSSILLIFLIVISFNGFIKPFIHYKFDFLSLKYLVVLTFISSIYTFLFYFFKYNSLSIYNKYVVKYKSQKIRNEISDEKECYFIYCLVVLLKKLNIIKN